MSEPPNCKDCLSQIKLGAVKCVACGSFQNWRRHFTLTTTLLSFFLGAVAAAGIVKQPLEDFLRPTTSISVERIGVTAKGYTVLISNKGKAPGVIKYIHAFYGEEFVDLEGWDEDRIIKSGENSVLTLLWPKQETRPTDETLDYKRTFDSKTFNRCFVDFTIFAGEEVSSRIDERRDDGECNYDYDDFITGNQSIG